MNEKKDGGFHSDPLPDEIWRQTAKLIGEDPENTENVLVAVNDEHGILNKKESFNRKTFQEQFFPDPTEPLTYHREVLVEQSDDKSVHFVRLDAKGEPISATFRLMTRIFAQTYYFNRINRAQSGLK
jgi:hypothetical protein